MAKANWGIQQVHDLLSIVAMLDVANIMDKKTSRKDALFQDVQVELAKKGHSFTVAQIRNKWKKLREKYQKKISKSKKSGESGDAEEWEYFHVMNEILGHRPRNAVLVDTSSGVDSTPEMPTLTVLEVFGSPDCGLDFSPPPTLETAEATIDTPKQARSEMDGFEFSLDDGDASGTSTGTEQSDLGTQSDADENLGADQNDLSVEKRVDDADAAFEKMLKKSDSDIERVLQASAENRDAIIRAIDNTTDKRDDACARPLKFHTCSLILSCCFF